MCVFVCCLQPRHRKRPQTGHVSAAARPGIPPNLLLLLLVHVCVSVNCVPVPYTCRVCRVSRHPVCASAASLTSKVWVWGITMRTFSSLTFLLARATEIPVRQWLSLVGCCVGPRSWTGATRFFSRCRGAWIPKRRCANFADRFSSLEGSKLRNFHEGVLLMSLSSCIYLNVDKIPS